MKKLFLLFTLLTTLNSCLTVDRIKKHCDQFAQVCTTGTQTVIIKKDTTIYQTDTVFYTPPPDTIHIKEPVYISGSQAQIAPVHKTAGIIWVNAWVKNNWLNINAGLTDSTILIPHRDTVFLPDIFTQTITTQTVTQIKKVIPAWYKFTNWYFILTIAAAAFFIAGYLIRFKFKLLKLK